MKKSVTFFMLYHKRPELTRMSLWHMAKVVGRFKDAGHEVHTVVIGDEENQRSYCDSIGLDHYSFKNDPLHKKFKFAWTTSIQKKTDYVCWLGSNNLNSSLYWTKALNKLKEGSAVSFGSPCFTVTHKNPKKNKTVLWTRQKHHICSCGQFFSRKSIEEAVDFDNVFTSERNKENHDFDGSINNYLCLKNGMSCIESVTPNELDCIDIKSKDDINTYSSYLSSSYDAGAPRVIISKLFEEIRMLDSGYFRDA